MKKNHLTKLLLTAAFAFTITCVNAHTNKTFMKTRSQGVNLALEHTGGYHELVHRTDKNKFGGTLQAIGFYSKSTNKREVGEYFGLNGKNHITIDSTKPVGNGSDLDAILFGIANGEEATIKLDPDQANWGVAFTYHQWLDKFLKGLHFSISMPIVHVENDVNLCINGSAAESVKKFFAGEQIEFRNLTSRGDQLDPLNKALIKGKDSSTGIPDIELLLGYNVLDEDSYHASVNVGFSVPTGNEPDGKRFFEAVHGNGQHFGFGGGAEFGARAWGDHNHNVKVQAAFNYRYLFESSEKRTLALKGNSLSQFFPLVDIARTEATSPIQRQRALRLIPAANITTLSVDVTPGSQFDGVFNIAYNNGHFSLDGGYNLYFREAESVKLKHCFKEGAYGATLFGANLNNPLTADDLDTSSAETPSQTTHKLYASIAYIFKHWNTPVNVGFGGHYEWASRNSVLEGWGLNGRLGISF